MALEKDPKETSADEPEVGDKTSDAPPGEREADGGERSAREREAANLPKPPALESAEEAPQSPAELEADEAIAREAFESEGGAAPSEGSEDASEKAAKAPPNVPLAIPIRGARWADPIAGFERRWTWLEARLLTFVLMWQLLALVAWVLLSGISSPASSGDAAGVTFRATVAAILLGIVGWTASKKLSFTQRRLVTVGGIALGVMIGLVLRPSLDATGGMRLAVNRALGLNRVDDALVNYFGNVKSWLQDGSTLTLMGGLRGLATRLTLWLALLGGSLATAAGKHIHIDVIFRFLPKRLRVPAAIINFIAAAAVCFAGAWGFVDHIAIESFESKADDAAGAKIARVVKHMGNHAFLTRKQIGLDLRTLPHVLASERYDQWMTGPAWNEWVKDAGFEDHYTPDEVKTILVPDDSPPHPPLVLAPDGAATRGILVHDLNLVFPFGLLAIGLRFLLRALLTMSGHIPIDPDAAHKEELHSAASEPAKVGGV